jgi:hypothetical protein
MQQASQSQQDIQQALAPVHEFMQQQRQAQETQHNQAQQQIGTDLQAFEANHEFYADVRLEMADWLDMAAKRGTELSLEQAYERAIQTRPDLQTILSARTSQQQVTDRTAAASSIQGSPGGSTAQAAPTDTRSIMEAQWPVGGPI